MSRRGYGILSSCNCKGGYRLTCGVLVAMLALLVLAALAGRACAQEPPGVRFVLTAEDAAPCAVMLSALAEHRSLHVMSPERFAHVLDRLENAELLRATADAQAELIVALRAHVQALEGERQAREDLTAALRMDLAAAERSIIKTPRRSKAWLWVGVAAGAGAMYLAEN